MAIIVKHSFDGKLPPAALYLDDVERIVEILKSKTPDNVKRAYGGAEPRFVVGDTECDTIDELRQLGERINTLEIKAPWFYLSLSPDRAGWRCWVEGTELEVYGLLLPIFQARQRSFPGLRGSTPLIAGLLAVGWMLLTLIVSAIGSASTFYYHHRIAGPLFWVLGIVLVISLRAPKLPYSTIHLRFKRDPVPDSARWMPGRQELVRMLITALISLLVGWVLGRLK